MIRPHEIALVPANGHGAPAVVRGLRETGPLRLVDVELAGRVVEVQLPEREIEVALTAGTACALDLRRAQVYPAEG